MGALEILFIIIVVIGSRQNAKADECFLAVSSLIVYQLWPDGDGDEVFLTLSLLTSQRHWPEH